jgi:hypothetical protein
MARVDAGGERSSRVLSLTAQMRKKSSKNRPGNLLPRHPSGFHTRDEPLSVMNDTIPGAVGGFGQRPARYRVRCHTVRGCRTRLAKSRVGRRLIHGLNWNCLAMLCAQAGQKIKNSSRNESDECADKEGYGCASKRPVQELKRRNRIRRSRIVPAGLIHQPGQRKINECACQRSGGQNNQGINPHPTRSQKQYRSADNDGCAVSRTEENHCDNHDRRQCVPQPHAWQKVESKCSCTNYRKHQGRHQYRC